MEIYKNIKNITFSSLALLAFAISSPAYAAITVDSVTGSWSNVTSGQNITGVGTNEIRWGSEDGNRSGYRFDGAAPLLFPVTIGTPFDLGTFTHFNEPIPRGSGITGARLSTNVDLTIDGTPITNLNFLYDFDHNETPNELPCQAGSVSVCDDIVSLINNTPISDVFNIGGIDYTIKVIGFEVSGVPFSQFMTQENLTNIATLKGIITVPDVPVPEPTTYLLLALPLFVCMFLRHRKISQA